MKREKLFPHDETETLTIGEKWRMLVNRMCRLILESRIYFLWRQK